MLFIGGPWDGEDKEVAEFAVKVLAAEPPDEPLRVYSLLPQTVPTAKIRTYTRRSWCADGQYIALMADDRMSDIDTMRRLVEGYKP